MENVHPSVDKDYTEIIAVLDMSGSMAHLTADTIGGFNSFIKSQKDLPGKALVSLVLFDNRYIPVYSAVDIREVPDLTPSTYIPTGSTALYDALGKTIDQVGNRLKSIPSGKRPGKVVFLIITDGHENASIEFTRESVKSKIDVQQNSYNWQFVFMGANIDSYAEGSKLSMYTSHTINYAASSLGTNALYRGISESVSNFRMGNKSSMAWTESEKKTVEEGSHPSSSSSN